MEVSSFYAFVLKLIRHVFLGMTVLEEWTLACIVTVFGSLFSFGIILSRDQMIIQEIYHTFCIYY